MTTVALALIVAGYLLVYAGLRGVSLKAELLRVFRAA